MNIDLILKEFKQNSRNLLDYNKRKLIQTLQQHGFYRISNSYATGPVAPIFCSTSVTGPTGTIGPEDECIYCPTGPQTPTGATGPTGIYQNAPTGPAAPTGSPTGVFFTTIDEYISNFECYINISSPYDLANLNILNHEIRNHLVFERKIIKNFTNATNYHTSQIMMFRRKIHEYNILIEKQKAKLVDFKTNIIKEYEKKNITHKELNDIIQKEIDKRSAKAKTPNQLENIPEQVRIEYENKYSTNVLESKYEQYSTGWSHVKKYISYLEKERDKYKKLAAPSPTPLSSNLKKDEKQTIYGQDKQRIEELKKIKQVLLERETEQEYIDDINNKLAELENKYK